MALIDLFFKNIYNYDNKLSKSYYTINNNKNIFITFIITVILYTLADNYYFDLYQYRWFENIKNIILLYIFLISIIALASAFFIEHVLGHQPCNLCILERIPYLLSIIIILPSKLTFLRTV